MATADGGVVPKPGPARTEGPKTLGILNVIFGALLILLGFCTIGVFTVGPVVVGGIEKVAKGELAKAEDRQKQLAKEYDDRIAKAKTDDEKKQIEADKTSVIVARPQVKFDLSAFSDMFKNPTIMRVNYAGALTGLALHIALLASGIGLIRLTPWGRSLALWWGGLQLIQVIALMIVTINFVHPIQRAQTDVMLAEFQKQMNVNEKAPKIDPVAINSAKAMSALLLPITIGQSLAGCVYPVVLMILLNTADARAACRPKKPKVDTFDFSEPFPR